MVWCCHSSKGSPLTGGDIPPPSPPHPHPQSATAATVTPDKPVLTFADLFGVKCLTVCRRASLPRGAAELGTVSPQQRAGAETQNPPGKMRVSSVLGSAFDQLPFDWRSADCTANSCCVTCPALSSLILQPIKSPKAAGGQLPGVKTQSGIWNNLGQFICLFPPSSFPFFI